MKHIPSVIYKRNLSRSSIVREFFKKEKNVSGKEEEKKFLTRVHRLGVKRKF